MQVGVLMLPGPVLDEDLHVAGVGGAAVEHLRVGWSRECLFLLTRNS
jgi:hypothetical protein